MLRFTFVLVSLLFLNSCFLGVYKIEANFPDNLKFVNKNLADSEKITIEDKENNLVVELSWMGNSYPLETSKSMVGLTNRFVVPYTRSTSLLKVKIINSSKNLIELNKDKIVLKADKPNLELKPLGIDFFKKKWPTFAVKTQEHMIDQSVAIGDVIRTIVRDTEILPDSTYEAYIPFKKLEKEVEVFDILFTLKINNQDKNLVFNFKKK